MSDKLLAHDTLVISHINDVRTNLHKLTKEILERSKVHDESKLQSPEREVYAEHTGELGKVQYGSPEYQALLDKVKPAVEHHWANNRHHPEHWPNGINDMDLVDLLEMIADWTASTKKNKSGNIHKSIKINTERFKLEPQLVQILTNTVNRYF